MQGTRSIVLLHMTKMGFSQVVHTHLSAVLAERDTARTVAYRFERRPPALRRMRLAFDRVLGRPQRTDRLDVRYADIVDETVVLLPSRSACREVDREVARYRASGPSRQDLERFTVRGVPIGDLVYDKVVRVGHVVVDPLHPDVLRYLEQFAEHVIALDDYFDRNEVLGVVSASAAYEPGIASRVAVKRAVPAFIAGQDASIRVSTHRPRANLESMDYRSRLARLPPQRRDGLIEEARRFVSGLVDGESGDLTTSGQRPWATDRAAVALDPAVNADRLTVLVAVHSFYDDPHAAGVGLFPDFFTWIEHLVGLFDGSEYRWLFKLHPDQRDDRIGVRSAIETLLGPHEHALILDEGVGHPQLLASGIDLVLTVYGTIGFEYPAAGVPVLTAGPENPHRPFTYCRHADTVEEYDAFLLDPTAWAYPIQTDEILEYVAMHYLQKADYPFHDLPFVRRHLSGSGQYFKSADFPDLWAAEATDEHTEALMEDLRAWVDSGTYDFRAFLADRSGLSSAAYGDRSG